MISGVNISDIAEIDPELKRDKEGIWVVLRCTSEKTTIGCASILKAKTLENC